MKKLLKSLLPLGAIASAAVPAAVAASCGKKPIDLSKTIVLHMDSKFVNGKQGTKFEEITKNAVEKWKKEFPAEAKKFSVIVDTTKTNQDRGLLQKVSYTDEKVSDLFFVPVDQFEDMDRLGAIMDLSNAPGFKEELSGHKYELAEGTYSITEFHGERQKEPGMHTYGIPFKKEVVEAWYNLAQLKNFASTSAEFKKLFSVTTTADTYNGYELKLDDSATKTISIDSTGKKITINTSDMTKLINALKELNKWYSASKNPTTTDFFQIDANEFSMADGSYKTTVDGKTMISIKTAQNIISSLFSRINWEAMMDNNGHLRTAGNAGAKQLSWANSGTNGWYSRALMYATPKSGQINDTNWFLKVSPTDRDNHTVSASWLDTIPSDFDSKTNWLYSTPTTDSDFTTPDDKVGNYVWNSYKLYYEMAKGLKEEGITQEYLDKWGGDPFATGRAFMTIQGPWFDQTIESAFKNQEVIKNNKGLGTADDLIAAPMPLFNGHHTRHFANGWAWVVNNRNAQWSEKTTALSHIVKQLSSVESTKSYYDSIEHFLPCQKNQDDITRIQNGHTLSEAAIEQSFKNSGDYIVKRNALSLTGKYQIETLYGDILKLFDLTKSAYFKDAEHIHSWTDVANQITTLTNQSRQQNKWGHQA